MGESYVDELKCEIESLKEELKEAVKSKVGYAHGVERGWALIEEYNKKKEEIRAQKTPLKFAYFTFIPCWILSYAALLFFIPGSEYHTTPMLIATIIWAILEIVNVYICIRYTAKGGHLRVMALYLIVFHLPYVGIYAAVVLPNRIEESWNKLIDEYSDKISGMQSAIHMVDKMYNDEIANIERIKERLAVVQKSCLNGNEPKQSNG